MSFISSKEVQRRSGYSRVTVWRKASNPEDDFPAPRQLSPKRIGWDENEYSEWERTRPRVSYAPRHQAPANPLTTADGAEASP